MNNIGIYIHIPFCEQKCNYCDFYSICDKSEFDRYTEKLISVIMQSKYTDRVVDTIYFGGGTPSVLGEKRLVAILNTIKQSFEITKDAEITLEVNPCSAEYIDFSVLKTCGFNRLSIGLQSSNEKELKTLGRRHSAKDAQDTVKRARNASFDNISLDLMLCIPHQTKNSLTESIKFCKDCGVEHISAYILKIEENTPFYIIKNELNLFNDDEQAQFYLHAVKQLDKFGYHQYEISNFSKPQYEGKHNLKYWHDEEYLGFGPSAHSFIDSKRYYYNRSLDDFYNDLIIEDGKGGEIEEYIMLRLRLKEGLKLTNLKDKYNYTVKKSLLTMVEKLCDNQLVTFKNDTIALTTKGFLVSNSIINYIIESL